MSMIPFKVAFCPAQRMPEHVTIPQITMEFPLAGGDPLCSAETRWDSVVVSMNLTWARYYLAKLQQAVAKAEMAE